MLKMNKFGFKINQFNFNKSPDLSNVCLEYPNLLKYSSDTDLINKKINYKHKKDYYFLVLNKNNNKHVIVNSVKGLKKITPNINNLPFQVKWNVNQEFQYKHIQLCVKDFLDVIKKPNPSWKETFFQNVRNHL